MIHDWVAHKERKSGHCIESPSPHRVYLYRAIDQNSQVIDVLVSEKRDIAVTRQLDELLPTSCHVTEQYANNVIEADHGRLKLRLRPMRGLKQLRCARD